MAYYIEKNFFSVHVITQKWLQIMTLSKSSGKSCTIITSCLETVNFCNAVTKVRRKLCRVYSPFLWWNMKKIPGDKITSYGLKSIKKVGLKNHKVKWILLNYNDSIDLQWFHWYEYYLNIIRTCIAEPYKNSLFESFKTNLLLFKLT